MTEPGIYHSTYVDVPDDEESPVGTDEWNRSHNIGPGTITEDMLAPGVIISGPVGATGATGEPGTRWYTGHGVPLDANGHNGDFYLNLDTGDIYDKVSGTWF